MVGLQPGPFKAGLQLRLLAAMGRSQAIACSAQYCAGSHLLQQVV